jgi:hypothetical protein
MYGAVLPDAFNYLFDARGEYLYQQTHFNFAPFYEASRMIPLRGIGFGFVSHNNEWGADFYAHTSAVGTPGTGYALAKAEALMPHTVPVIAGILMSAGLPEDQATAIAGMMAPALGHDLAETAVDLLVRRNLDPGVGLRMLLAAQARPASVPGVLASVYGPGLATFAGLPLAEAKKLIMDTEKEARQIILQYGGAFMLPEEQTMALLAGQMAPLAELFIENALAGNGIPLDVTVEPDQVAALMVTAVGVVEADYQAELAATLTRVAIALQEHGIGTGRDLVKGDAERTPATGVLALEQNFPNPFNPSTSITYTLPAATRARVAVFNSLGQEVAVLLNGEIPAGSHTVSWDASAMPSGIYFCRLESDAGFATRRMMLVK